MALQSPALGKRGNPRSGSPRRAFVLLLLASAVGSLAWAGLARIDVIVRTEGQIIPAGKSQLVQHLEGGIVRSILVQEGKVVEEGQPLIELSDVQTRSDLGQEQSKLEALQGREARLVAEVAGADAIAFPAALSGSEVVRVEKAAWLARRTRLAEEVRVLKSLSLQKENELAEVEAKHRNLIDELALARKKHRIIDDLQRSNAASELEVLDSHMRVQKLEAQIDEAKQSAPRLRAAKDEADARVQEAIARVKAEASSELTQVRGEIEKLRHEIDGSVDRLQRNIVRSPVAGLVNRLNVTTIGAVVRPSEVLLEITPSDQRIVIETRSNPDDRAHLRRGLKAKVRIGAYDYATYGTFDGHVTEVSADTLQDEVSGGRYYRVNLEVDVSRLVARLRKPGELMPGMAATADIVVGKRTVLSYILSPLLEFRDGAFRAN